jgi:hypothetical protein
MELDAPDGAEPARYRLTESGRDLGPVIVAITRWGDRCATTGDPPVQFGHDHCPGPVDVATVCRGCGNEICSGELLARPGGGAQAG